MEVHPSQLNNCNIIIDDGYGMGTMGAEADQTKNNVHQSDSANRNPGSSQVTIIIKITAANYLPYLERNSCVLNSEIQITFLSF